jgi:predicted dehydrogenase
VLELLDEAPVAVRGATHAYVQPHIADFAYADLTFTRGRSAHIETSWLDPDKSSRLDVFGASGVLCLNDAPGGATLTMTPCGTRCDEFERPTLWRENSREVEFTPAEPLVAELCAFIESCSRGLRPPTDGESGLEVVKVLSMLGARDQVSTEKLQVGIA